MRATPPTPQSNARRRTKIFLLLSALTHGLILLASRGWTPPPFTPPTSKVEVTYLDPDAQKDPKDASRRNQRTQQIVEQQKQINDEVDKKTRLLSAFNQKVIQETRAERSGKFTNTASGGKPTEGSKNFKKQANDKSRAKILPSDRGELPALKDLTPKFSLEQGLQGPQADINGNPSQSDDYLQDVQPGLQTLLSTREFVYYAYYARIKDALRQHWEPTVREKVKIIYRQGRNIASAKDRVTQVLVTLNSQGELIRVDVLSASGVEDLDSAAIEAFQNASPFPNPPKGMVESDGTVKIRWDFVLEA